MVTYESILIVCLCVLFATGLFCFICERIPIHRMKHSQVLCTLMCWSACIFTSTALFLLAISVLKLFMEVWK